MMRVTVLGCGTSAGVPRIGNRWGACDPGEPKNRRRRVSVLVEQGGDALLIDTSPDLREQLLTADVQRLDGVLWTHDHADHTHGLDDLRGLYPVTQKPMPAYSDAATLAALRHRFTYAFEGARGYPPIITGHEIAPYTPFSAAGMTVQPFLQQHGPVHTLGYRIGDFAYSTDVNGFPPESEPFLHGLSLWIVDCLRRTPHPTHAHLDMTLAWIARFKPQRAILTHMDVDMDYQTLRRDLPPNVEPGYDGMVWTL